MKKTFSILFLFISSYLYGQQAINLDDVRNVGLYVVEITTVDQEEPEGIFITKPGDEEWQNIIYKNKVPCRIVISRGEEVLYDSGPYVDNTSGATIRITGNNSAYYSHPLNMPYRIKLEKASDLLFRGNDDIYKDKTWRLYKDAVNLNTITALKLSEVMEMEWTMAYVPCNVIINGDYRGYYLLTETMKRNAQCRVNCDKKKGYIVEKDAYWWKENKYFTSTWYKDDNVFRWTWKYPDEEDVTEDNELYIKGYIERMEESLQQGNYEDYIDLSSFAKWLLSHDVLGTDDTWGSNMFIKKYDETDQSRLELPCLWDFDSSYLVPPGSFSNFHSMSNEYFKALMNSSNPSFREAYVKLWNDKKEEITNTLITFLTQFEDSEEAKAIDASRQLHYKRWGTQIGTIKNNVDKTLGWINTHIPLLDKQIQSIAAGISDINESPRKTARQYYNLQGMKLNTAGNNSIVICRDANGKTMKITKALR